VGHPGEDVLVPILWTEGTLLLLAVAVLIGHAVWWQLQRAVVAERRESAQRELVTFLQQHHGRESALPVFASLRRKEKLRCLLGLAASLKGQRAELLTGLSVRYGLVAWAEYRCRSRLWWRRLYAARLLTIIGGGRHWMLPLLRDRDPSVRSAAAEWAVGNPTPDVMEALLPLLSDAAGICRFTAQDSLLRIGEKVVEPLIAYLKSASSEEAEPALNVAVSLGDARLLSPALAFHRDSLPPTRRNAARLLGALGGGTAVRTLLEMTGDPEPTVRAAAARGLGVLERTEAAPHLAELLRDRSWQVRRQAGLALRALGSTGRMYLRRALTDQDRFAADMARQVIDLPESVGRLVSP
jgi:HEAT repeat protein